MTRFSKSLAITLISLITAGTALAQESGSGESSSSKTRGSDPNIEVSERVNTKGKTITESKVIQPVSKGARSRGGYCDCCFDNYTSWYIDTYVDGYLEGYIGPWGEGCVTVGAGYTSLYAVAEFDDGSRISWGPVSANCNYQDFTLEVHDAYYNWFLD